MVHKYYQKHKEKLRKVARERYQNLSEEEKEKKRQHHLNKNLSEEEKKESWVYY